VGVAIRTRQCNVLVLEQSVFRSFSRFFPVNRSFISASTNFQDMLRGCVLGHEVRLDGNAFALKRRRLQDHARSYCCATGMTRRATKRWELLESAITLSASIYSPFSPHRCRQHLVKSTPLHHFLLFVSTTVLPIPQLRQKQPNRIFAMPG
jgi:hypothetical protein